MRPCPNASCLSLSPRGGHNDPSPGRAASTRSRACRGVCDQARHPDGVWLVRGDVCQPGCGRRVHCVPQRPAQGPRDCGAARRCASGARCRLRTRASSLTTDGVGARLLLSFALAGKHVLCEKPIASNAAEAKEMVAAAAAAEATYQRKLVCVAARPRGWAKGRLTLAIDDTMATAAVRTRPCRSCLRHSTTVTTRPRRGCKRSCGLARSATSWTWRL